MHEKWDERYKEDGFAYGKKPNVFFEEWLPKFIPKKILMPADGEGRNGVFAASLGWEVTSFDLSIEGRQKALQLAAETGVALQYIVGDLEELEFEAASFDAIGLVYAHFPADRKQAFHKKLNGWLKPGGVIIFEAFAKDHLQIIKLNPETGGPKDIEMLYTEAEILNDFKDYELLLLKEEEIVLQEGKYHNGMGAVIRFVGEKATVSE